jgi:predicted nucleotidyltransferase
MNNAKSSTATVDILNQLEENIKTIKKFGVMRIALFGFAVRGDLTRQSDVDLFIEFEEQCEKFSNLINLYFFLQNLLHRTIELVTPDSISPYLAPYILKEVKFIEKLS